MTTQPLTVTTLDAFGNSANFSKDAPVKAETLGQRRRREATEAKNKPQIDQIKEYPTSEGWTTRIVTTKTGANFTYHRHDSNPQFQTTPQPTEKSQAEPLNEVGL